MGEIFQGVGGRREPKKHLQPVCKLGSRWKHLDCGLALPMASLTALQETQVLGDKILPKAGDVSQLLVLRCQVSTPQTGSVGRFTVEEVTLSCP